MSTVKLKPERLPLRPSAPEARDIGKGAYMNAYERVLLAERQAIGRFERNPTDKTAQDNMISARVAGYLLIELWDLIEVLTDAPCLDLAESLVSPPRGHGDPCKAVFDIGKFYRNYFLRLFRTSTEKYPPPSTHPSRPSFNTKKDEIKEIMEVDSKDHKTARRKALARDGFRCVLTGAFDARSLKTNVELALEAEVSYNATVATVTICHIVNESTMQDVNPGGDGKGGSVVNKTDYAANPLGILDSFGPEDIVQSLLAQNGIHDLGNLISLEPTCHGYFDNLELWFERTDEPNRYRVCVVDSFRRNHILNSGHLKTDDSGNVFVIFARSDERQTLPDPQLLGLHAACARVAHLSGAAEAFDELERDVEETLVLSSDGSSACLLDHLLTPFATIPGVA